MGRPRRIQFPGACYLITLCGNNQQAIFLSNQDRRFFLTLLRDYKERHGLRVFAYCLSDDGVQLLLETSRPDLARVMQGLNTAYTKYFNRVHHTTGHVLQGRYQALLVDADRYLAELSSYVHLAPVRMGIKERPWRYLWSSCAAYVEFGSQDPLVESEPVLRRFAKNRLKQSVQYLHFIRKRLRETGGRADFPVRKGCVAEPEFIAALKPSWADEDVRATLTSTSEALEKARRILREMSGGMDEDRLLGRARWRELSSVRKAAVHRIWREAGLGVTEIARLFRRTPSAISQLIRAIELPKLKI
ncbi:MAG: transposase [Elusimicrobia bacterium]|nr:transposase [Elusimicrobiota bacterium]